MWGTVLTFWVVDDQMKRLLARSVVRPFHSNMRVKWDPAFEKAPIKQTAKSGGDVCPDKQTRELLLDSSMDRHDLDEPDPQPHHFPKKEPKKQETQWTDEGFELPKTGALLWFLWNPLTPMRAPLC